jgi:preprotein translocase subunit SecF
MSGVLSRLYRGETTFNFVGRRWWGFGLSLFLIVVTMLSFFTRGLNLGIDFEGGVAWEVPAASLTVADVTEILEANGVDTADAKIQSLNGSDGPRIRVQVAEQSDATKSAVQGELAAMAKVDVQDVSVSSVSSSWGRSITEKAVRALLIFFVLVSIFIAWRFEWKMALSAILAMAHDVFISVGVYSVTGLPVTPATVIAFLTILGFSLYDTIVVFDKVHDNTTKYSASRVSYADITNISMNQVLMRSINTSLAAVLPVLSLLVLGSWILGAVALEEFAIALLVGLALGAYSSIFVATPLLAVFKTRESKYASMADEVHIGAEMARIAGSGKKTVQRVAATAQDTEREVVLASSALTHPPRPRKKRRR